MNADNPDYWKDILTKPLSHDKYFWIKENKFSFNFNTLNLMALHGFLCLALRHPGTLDHSCRPAITELVKEIGTVLVDLGALSPEQLAQIQKIEEDANAKVTE